MPMFLDTRGQPTLGIAICGRCQIKRRIGDLIEDGNIPGLMVCNDKPGCYDTYDPMRLPPPPPDNLLLPFVRTNVPLLPTAADEAQLPLQPPPQED